jgi:NAD(P)-dependent dehydrogenase (short-subunit alcohol dehydrogenase family)
MAGTDSAVFRLDNRVALVTGGASGIGAGIAELLAESGALVVIVDVDEAKAAAQVEALRAAGHRADHVVIDLADETSIVKGCSHVVEAHGVPWVLVNNAGLQDRQLLLDGTAAEWDRMNSVNARGPFLMTREIARAMARVGQGGGRIVNIASTALTGQIIRGLGPYSASKGALLALSRASAFELAEYGITVNTILPGGVPTPGSMAAKGPPAEGPARRMPPLGMCEPRDIAAAVLFCATPAARFMTNQVITVDAGFSIT